MTEQVLERVRALLPGIAARAAAADTDGVVCARTVEELTAAGVLRMLKPARFGGAEGHPVRFSEVIRAISEVCGSTGWVASVLGVHPWYLGLFDERVQKEVWADDPDAVVSSSYGPAGRLTAVEGGYELTGHWSFSSGCRHASWALLGGLVTGTQDFLTVLVPATDYTIEEVWDVVGLRGTASDDIVVGRAFVPEHRTLRNDEQARVRGPGQRVNTGPLYRMPFAAIFTSAVTAPVVGAASGCYGAYLSAMRDRIRMSPGGVRFSDDPFAHVAVARAASEIDAAILQMDRNLSEIYECAVEGREIPMTLRLRTRRDQVRGTERALHAIDLLFTTAGGNSLKRGNPIERAWRDAHAGGVHVANDVERALAMYGRSAFGLPVEDGLF